MMIVTGSYSLDLPGCVDGLRLLRRLRYHGLAGYWRLDFDLYRRNSRKGRAATEAESCVLGVRFPACLA